MRKTLCVVVLTAFAAVLSACSKSPELIRMPLNKKDNLLETIIIDDEYVRRSDEEEARRHFRTGKMYSSLGMFEKAFNEYFEAMKLDKKPVYLDSLGSAAARLKRFGDARYFFEESLKQDPSRVTSLANLAFVDLIEGKYEPAERKYTTACMKEPNNMIINYNLGNTILISVLTETRKQRESSENKDVIILTEQQIERLRRARRYFGNVMSLPFSNGRYAVLSDEKECKREAEKTLMKINHALAKYRR